MLKQKMSEVVDVLVRMVEEASAVATHEREEKMYMLVKTMRGVVGSNQGEVQHKAMNMARSSCNWLLASL
jgi:hypothetical protein